MCLAQRISELLACCEARTGLCRLPLALLSEVLTSEALDAPQVCVVEGVREGGRKGGRKGGWKGGRAPSSQQLQQPAAQLWLLALCIQCATACVSDTLLRLIHPLNAQHTPGVLTHMPHIQDMPLHPHPHTPVLMCRPIADATRHIVVMIAGG